MALEFLFTDVVENGKKIAVHPEATHLRCRDGKVKQYKCNPMPLDSMRKISKGTNYIVFEYYTPTERYIDYGRLICISHKGNILKEGRY
tara:strand:- start:438 stop:704 length:267 start_codon:yes stop_codon:yes gene_type:complete